MSIYLGYVSGGVCRDTHAPTKDDDGNPIRVGMIRKQWWVIEELRRIGIDAWCGKRMEFKRVGNAREWTAFTEPAMPNYIVVDIHPSQMFQVISVPHVMPTMALIAGEALNGADARPDVFDADGNQIKWARPAVIGLKQFQDDTDAAYEEAERVNANSRAEVTAYRQGQELRVMRGPFMDMLVNFDKLVRRPGSKWQTLAVTTEGGVRVEFDPLDVRSA